MRLFVDTSVWSLAFRRDAPGREPAVVRLSRGLAEAESIFTTSLVLQELLQGFRGPRAHDRIVERFAALPFLVPERGDHVGAASLRNDCRRRGVQIGTIDALFAELCIRRELTMLSTDRDFERIARHTTLDLWHSSSS